MKPETAEIVLFVIAGIAAGVWVLGMLFLFSAAKTSQTQMRQANDPFETDAWEPRNSLHGQAEVEGDPGELATRTAALLVKSGRDSLGSVKVLKKTDDRVEFESSGTYGGHSNLPACRGQIRLAPSGTNQTTASYMVEVTGGRWLLRIGYLVQVVGLAALVAGFLLIRTHLVPHPSPAARWQTFQMAQIIHFLWPPFLLGGLYRMQFRQLRSTLDTLISNLPYHQE